MIEKCLSLSNVHVNPSEIVDAFMVGSDQDCPILNTGGLRSVWHENGWVIFVNIDRPNVPDWLAPIHDRAIDEGATLILFDRDGVENSDFAKYPW